MSNAPEFGQGEGTLSRAAGLVTDARADFNKIADRIRKMKPGGGAAFFDAIYQACTTRELVKGDAVPALFA